MVLVVLVLTTDQLTTVHLLTHQPTTHHRFANPSTQWPYLKDLATYLLYRTQTQQLNTPFEHTFLKRTTLLWEYAIIWTQKTTYSDECFYNISIFLHIKIKHLSLLMTCSKEINQSAFTKRIYKSFYRDLQDKKWFRTWKYERHFPF